MRVAGEPVEPRAAAPGEFQPCGTAPAAVPAGPQKPRRFLHDRNAAEKVAVRLAFQPLQAGERRFRPGLFALRLAPLPGMRADDPQEPVGGTKTLDVHLAARTRGQLYQLAKAEMQVLAEAVAVDPAQPLHAGRLVAGEEERVAYQCGRREVAIDRLAVPAGKLAGEEQLHLLNGLLVGQGLLRLIRKERKSPPAGSRRNHAGRGRQPDPGRSFHELRSSRRGRQNALGQRLREPVRASWVAQNHRWQYLTADEGV